MPIFTFTSPEGKKYTVNGPDGATQEQAFRMLQTQIGQTGQPAHQDSKSSRSPENSLMDDIKQGAGNLVAGAVRGAGSIGAFITAPYDMVSDALDGKGVSLESNRQRRSDMDAALKTMGADPNSTLYKAGKLGTEIAGTLPVGGLVAKGITKLAPSAAALAESVATGGFKAGETAGLSNLATRVAGGAINGGASTALVDPDHAGSGAAIGAAVPGGAWLTGHAGSYLAKTAKSIVQPFTEAGQNVLTGKIADKFAKDGPTAINAAEIVPGSFPTLAEATNNAGLARLQSTVRDISPNKFVERETANAAARNSAFDKVSGDSSALELAKSARKEAAGSLYDEALNRDPEPLTPYLKGQVTQLLKRPSIDSASRQAQKFALERGDTPAPEGSLQALHDVKTELGDKIGELISKGKTGAARAVQQTQDKLLDVMEKLSPEYKDARETYAKLSQPVNSMEFLQGLNISDAKGNITLSKVQNAIHGLEKLRSAPGVNTAKSLTGDQINVLTSIRDDLLRQSNLNAGKSAGSNTFQNIATDNILESILPGKLGGIVNPKIGGLAGQLGRLAYSGPNEAIRSKLVEISLDPSLAESAIKAYRAKPQLGPLGASLRTLSDQASPAIYRSLPVLSASR